MNELRKELFISAHQCGNASFYPNYKKVINNQWKSSGELILEQEKQLRRMIEFAYQNVPYYHSLFKNLRLFPADICTIADLEKLPVLTKDIIKKQWDQFQPQNLSTMKYYNQATGGSTGEPMQYRLSKYDRFLGAAILYRGWGYGGYQLGDKMVFLAGTSLDVGKKSYLIKKVHEAARNIRKLSSFDMGEIEMVEYAKLLNKFKPLFIRGYAASIYQFSRWLQENNVPVPTIKAVFTTAEKLYPNMRKTIGDIFDCNVYDNYGLQDGGISAYECPEHNGLHIDTERSILEVVDVDGRGCNRDRGRILATSLNNYAMPFIRYETGDLGAISPHKCNCGRGSPLLIDIVGREKELLITPQGQYVHGAALIGLLYIVLESKKFPNVINKIKEFQIIQKKVDKLDIIFVCDEPLPDIVLEFIKSLIQKRFIGWSVEFHFVDSITKSPSGKYRFIINEVMHAK